MLKKIGDITVDSGLLYTGDPSYKRSSINNIKFQISSGISVGGDAQGVFVATGGDGDYPIYVRTRDTGQISDRSLGKVIFDFTDDSMRNPGSNVRTSAVGMLALILLMIINKNVP